MKLGRGLDALLPQRTEALAAPEAREISVEAIEASSYQSRKNFNEEDLKSLAESIKTYGVLEPVLVGKKAPGKYVLLAGERRWRAAQMECTSQVGFALLLTKWG
jgi:ParB family chromosome partitioning protein